MSTDRAEVFGDQGRIYTFRSLRNLAHVIHLFPFPRHSRAQRPIAPEPDPQPIENSAVIFSNDPLHGPSEIPPENHLAANLGADRHLSLEPKVIDVQALYRSQKPFYNRGVHTNRGSIDGRRINRGRFISA